MKPYKKKELSLQAVKKSKKIPKLQREQHLRQQGIKEGMFHGATLTFLMLAVVPKLIDLLFFIVQAIYKLLA